MKVAYNACFGGFSLSPLAQTELAKKKGVELFWYKGNGFKGPYKKVNVEDVPQMDMFGHTPSKFDLGDEIETIPNGASCYDYDDTGDRSDPDLIEVIERLGDKANGACASLAIAEIPDGAEYEIDEYDGNESVVPPRMSW